MGGRAPQKHHHYIDLRADTRNSARLAGSLLSHVGPVYKTFPLSIYLMLSNKLLNNAVANILLCYVINQTRCDKMEMLL